LRELEINILRDISKTPEAKRLAIELLVTDFRESLVQLTKKGIQYQTDLKLGRWIFKISPPRQVGLLPVLFHAQPK
jgi:hypothetical protein